ncbi:MAG: biopolymer transporter ExbD [Bacteroidales bacterium]|nr:biopolymer transporter ExbD [Bacteroidales bacterium]
MSKFTGKKQKEVPAISTGSMPDIIFMLIFFFMVSTTMRQNTLLVKISAPEATQIAKLERKSLVSFIYMGQPTQKQLGTETRIQLNDQFATPQDIPEYIAMERESRDEADRKLLTTSLKVDKDVKMGIVTDVKQELRKVGAFKINYSTRKKVEKE